MTDTPQQSADSTLALATRIVTAYVSRNHVQQTELPALLARVHQTIATLDQPQAAEVQKVATPTAAEIRKSITQDYLISFEDGKRYKTLKRHLTGVGLTPETYRAKYGLPADYPMVSPGYSAQRSQLAKQIGLGQVARDELEQAA
jgi:predicted transcriptional regulator